MSNTLIIYIWAKIRFQKKRTEISTYMKITFSQHQLINIPNQEYGKCTGNKINSYGRGNQHCQRDSAKQVSRIKPGAFGDCWQIISISRSNFHVNLSRCVNLFIPWIPEFKEYNFSHSEIDYQSTFHHSVTKLSLMRRESSLKLNLCCVIIFTFVGYRRSLVVFIVAEFWGINSWSSSSVEEIIRDRR